MRPQRPTGLRGDGEVTLIRQQLPHIDPFPTPRPFPTPLLPYYRFTDVMTSRSVAGRAKRRHAMRHFTKYYVSHTSNFFVII